MTPMQTTNHHQERNWFSSIVAFVVVILFGLFILYFYLNITPPGPTTHQPIALVSSTINSVKFNPVHRTITYRDTDGFHLLDIQQKKMGELPMPFSIDPDAEYIFSPNYHFAAVVDSSRDLYLRDLTNGEQMWLGSQPTSIDWAVDESTLLYALLEESEDDEDTTAIEYVHVFDTETQEDTLLRELLVRDDESVSLGYSERPNHIIYSSDDGDFGYSYFEVNLNEPDDEDVYLDDLNIYSLSYSPSNRYLIYLPFTFELDESYRIKDFKTGEEKEVPFEFEGYDCTWDTREENMYCVDYSDPNNPLLPIQHYNLPAGTSTTIAHLNAEDYTTNGVMINDDQELFFMNLNDNRLYGMQLSGVVR